MGLKCGIVGLPNVGKSTIFNALTGKSNAQVANYPFCTIEPNTAIVSVPDERLYKLAEIVGSAKIIPAFIEFVDIAGLVEGASKGQGLGNKFLSHIREVDAIIHVIRCFNDKNVTHVHGNIDPVFDASIIETELILADLESVEKRIPNITKKAKNGDKIAKRDLELLLKSKEYLESGRPVRDIITEENRKNIYQLSLITSKPILYVCNVDEADIVLKNQYKTKLDNKDIEVISAKIESEIAEINDKDMQKEFLDNIGLSESGLDRIIKHSYNLLDLSSYFTVGPKEAHSWTFKKGTLASQAAGIIHTDFEKGFICAEVISYNDYIKYGSEQKVKENGALKIEGRGYYVQDGDVMNFKTKT